MRLVCAILILAGLQVHPAISSIVGSQEIPFTLRDGFLWIEVTIPGALRPFNFLLDSGAQVSVIDATTAKELGLKGGRAVSVMGVGNSATGFWPQTAAAQAGAVKLPRQYLALDLSTLSEACTNGAVDGIIGADFFHNRIIQVDYQRKLIRILPEAPTESGTQILPLKIRPCGILVPVRINASKTQWVRLDTGCASALQWVTGTIRPEQCTKRVAVALTKLSVPVTRTTLSLGPERFENVPTDLHAKEIFPGENGILGNGFLSRFKTVTVDARGGHLYLR